MPTGRQQPIRFLDRSPRSPLMFSLQALACAEPASIGEIGEYFVLPLAAEGSVYIVGCGHVGQALVPVLASLGPERYRGGRPSRSS